MRYGRVPGGRTATNRHVRRHSPPGCPGLPLSSTRRLRAKPSLGAEMGRQGYEKVKRQFDMEHRAPARSLLRRALPIAQMDRLIFAALAPTISTWFHQLFY